MNIKDLVKELEGTHDKEYFLEKYSEYLEDLKPYMEDGDNFISEWYKNHPPKEVSLNGGTILLNQYPPADMKYHYKGKIIIREKDDV